jgi:hypothetical protein
MRNSLISLATFASVAALGAAAMAQPGLGAGVGGSGGVGVGVGVGGELPAPATGPVNPPPGLPDLDADVGADVDADVDAEVDAELGPPLAPTAPGAAAAATAYVGLETGMSLRDGEGATLGEITEITRNPAGQVTRITIETADGMMKSLPPAGLRIEEDAAVTNMSSAEIQGLPDVELDAD